MAEFIASLEQLEALYGQPKEAATVKVTDRVTEDYRCFIAASPFLTLATVGPDGLDCSPRGDVPGFVRVLGDTQLFLPDRRGNNRVDSLRNIVRDPRVAILFLVPGCKTSLRVNGTARISIEPMLLQSFAIQGQAPRTVLSIQVAEVYFQCGRALIRSELWNPDRYIDDSALPTPGTILANLTHDRLGGTVYDTQWPERARQTLW